LGNSEYIYNFNLIVSRNSISICEIIYQPIPLNPLPLIREGGVDIREGQSPSPKPLPSPLLKGRGKQGEGLVNNL
jgi:hypothetical protein